MITFFPVQACSNVQRFQVSLGSQDRSTYMLFIASIWYDFLFLTSSFTTLVIEPEHSFKALIGPVKLWCLMIWYHTTEPKTTEGTERAVLSGRGPRWPSFCCHAWHVSTPTVWSIKGSCNGERLSGNQHGPSGCADSSEWSKPSNESDAVGRTGVWICWQEVGKLTSIQNCWPMNNSWSSKAECNLWLSG